MERIVASALRRLRQACLATGFVAGAVVAAYASEQSALLVGRGLGAFNAGEYEQARQLFDDALRADRADPDAWFYRGVTRGRLGDCDGALRDLHVVLAMKPERDRAALELGVALIGCEQFRDALPWLERARAVPALAPRATFFLGLAHLRLGERAAARRDFTTAAKSADQRRSARFYLGVIDYLERDWPTAGAHFAAVVADDPQSEMGREAARYLEHIGAGGETPYTLYGAFGFDYDSNVLLAPSGEAEKDALAISDQSDGRANLTAGGTYTPWRAEYGDLTLGYEFFQSLYFDLTEFNLQNHRPSIQLVLRTAHVELGLLGRYDYYMLETDSFLQQGTVLPWLRVPLGGFGHTEIFYRMRRRDFLDDVYAPRLDVFNHAAGVRQFVYLGTPNRYLWAGYRFDRNDAIHDQGRPFAYDGHEAEGGVGWAFPAWRANADMGYRFRHESYDAESGGRRDDEHAASLVVRQGLSDHVALTAAYYATFNDSNVDLFEYDRHIGSIGVEVRF